MTIDLTGFILITGGRNKKGKQNVYNRNFRNGSNRVGNSSRIEKQETNKESRATMRMKSITIKQGEFQVWIRQQIVGDRFLLGGYQNSNGETCLLLSITYGHLPSAKQMAFDWLEDKNEENAF